MKGHRLIIKRRVPKGRQQLLAVFVGAFVVVGMVAIAQLKTTLSERAMAAVKTDLESMRPASPTTIDLGGDEAAGEAVERFKKLLETSAE